MVIDWQPSECTTQKSKQDNGTIKKWINGELARNGIVTVSLKTERSATPKSKYISDE
jgi:hypothetical protein